MAKKPAKTTQFSIETAPSSAAAPSSTAAAPQKASASRTKKHLKAQALGVAAAVEGFVNAITQSPAEAGALAPVEAVPAELLTPVAAPVAAEEPVIQKIDTKISAAPVSHEEIAALAYSYYENRRGQGGSQAGDWFRAEQTLNAGR